METKAVYKSKLNAAGLLIALIGILELVDTTIVPETWIPYITFVIGVLVIIWRTFFTSTTLELPSRKK